MQFYRFRMILSLINLRNVKIVYYVHILLLILIINLVKLNLLCSIDFNIFNIWFKFSRFNILIYVGMLIILKLYQLTIVLKSIPDIQMPQSVYVLIQEISILYFLNELIWSINIRNIVIIWYFTIPVDTLLRL